MAESPCGGARAGPGPGADGVLVDIKMPPTYTDEGSARRRPTSRYPQTAVLVRSQYLVASYAALLLARSPERVGYLLKDNILNVEVLESALSAPQAGTCVTSSWSRGWSPATRRSRCSASGSARC